MNRDALAKAERAMNRLEATVTTQRVFKYPIPVEDVVTVALPRGAQVLTAQMQGDQLCLWALVDPDAGWFDDRTFRIAGTGHPITEDVQYISTFQMHGGLLVFHVFEVVNP